MVDSKTLGVDEVLALIAAALNGATKARQLQTLVALTARAARTSGIKVTLLEGDALGLLAAASPDVDVALAAAAGVLQRQRDDIAQLMAERDEARTWASRWRRDCAEQFASPDDWPKTHPLPWEVTDTGEVAP